MSNGVGPLDLMAAALARLGREDEGGGDEEVSELRQRYAALTPASSARLYGANGLLAGDRPPGGAGEAASVSNDGEVIARRPGPAIDLDRLPRAPLPSEAAGVSRAAEQRERLQEAQDERVQEAREARQEALRQDDEEEESLAAPPGSRAEIGRGALREDAAAGVDRYLEVERGKLALPTGLSAEVGVGRYAEQDREERGPVRRKPAATASREAADEYE